MSPPPPPAGLSVVIPTRNRIAKLEHTLTALEGQELRGLATELVVVDNGSSDGTLESLRSRDAHPGVPLRVHARSDESASAARNAGLRVASHPVVLFLGDDTAPASPGLLRAHADLHAAHPEQAYAVLGRTEWAQSLQPTPLMRWLEQGRQFAYTQLAAGTVGAKHLYTAHVSLKADLLREAGGFDERLPFLFEDVELGSRLAERGLELDYRPELLVHHDHHIRLDQWLARQRAAGRSGEILNSIRPHNPPLAPRPAGPGWAMQRAVAVLLRRLPTEYDRLPAPLREAVYVALDNAAYAEGYRGGRTAGG